MFACCMLAEQQEWMLAITLNIAFINRVDDKVQGKHTAFARADAAAVAVATASWNLAYHDADALACGVWQIDVSCDAL